MMKKIPETQIIIYEAEDGKARIDVRDDNSVIKDFLITASDGKQYKTKHYNMEAI